MTLPPRTMLDAGTVVDGKYRLVRTLGEGGMGVVYVAEHAFLKKHVALKLLRPELTNHPEVAVRFEQEAQTTSQLEHENIVRVTDFGRTAQNDLYLVMELLEGRSLAGEMAENAKIVPDRAIWITRQVLTGLGAAHDKGVVHRDLKPENVFLAAKANGDEVVKLVDFGIAKLRKDASIKLTTTGVVLGTPMYMAPEQARGVPDIDGRVDLHAAGVMLYEMLAGRPPYKGDNYNIVLYEILTGKPPHLREVAPEIDPKLADIVMKAFAPDRNARYQTASAFREALEDYVFAPSYDHGATTPDIPDRPKLVTLGGSTAPMAAVVTPAPIAPTPVAPAPVAPPPRPQRHHDPFAPPPDAAEMPLEIAAPQRPVARPTLAPPRPATQPPPAAQEVAPFMELAEHRRKHVQPQLWAKRIILALAGIGAAILIYNWWSAEPARQHQDARKPHSTITLDGLPENAFVFVDGIREFENPFELPLGSSPHELKIECEGYQSKTLSFVSSSDQTIDGHLERAAARKKR